MSFFGFDPSVPPHMRNDKGGGDVYEFQETYDGLGEQLDEADDELNSETFGDSQRINNDFDFASATGGQGGLQQSQPEVPKQPAVSYAQVVASTNDDEFMQDLWGTSNAPKNSQPRAPASQDGQKKVLSLEEIEAQLTSISQSQQQQPQLAGFPPQQYGIPGMMPPAHVPGYMFPPGFAPPPGQFGQFPMGSIPPIAPQNAPGYPNQSQPQFQGQPQPPQPQIQPHIPGVAQAQPQVHVPHGEAQQASQMASVLSGVNEIDDSVHQQDKAASLPTQNISPHQTQQVPFESRQRRPSKVDLSHFPVLGTKGPEKPQGIQGNFNGANEYSKIPRSENQYSQKPAQLTPEEQERLARRQEKVSRIMKYSGIMNPKDKDFVTRFQLSQIVTDDPYNEDFYAQVFKVVHPKTNGQPLQASQQHNSIAQAYLEQSGHRLGGRYKRADVALQRMQQQVQRAVTVAKERPKLTQYAKEGALGKISFGSGKKPRQQLEIFTKAAQKEIEKQEAEESKNQATSEKGTSTESVKPDKSKSVAPPSTTLKKYTKRDIMKILEDIIANLMNAESNSRSVNDLESSDLWNSLRVLEQNPSVVSNEQEINPFIQCLNFAKALKILPRLFKYLNREQILTIVTLIMTNLENLHVIKKGSYTTYPDKKLPESITSLVETYSVTFSKVLINAVQDFKFSEIIGLLVILMEHNNVSFVSTTKIGLSILTTLLSRAELVRGEGTISATDLSEWSSCYDELFTSLESKIAAIFPPHSEDADGASEESYVWQFLATLSLGGKLSHQRIIVDEVRDEIFGVMNKAKAIDNADVANLYKKHNLLNNLNMYLVVMGLVADDSEIKELQS